MDNKIPGLTHQSTQPTNRVPGQGESCTIKPIVTEEKGVYEPNKPRTPWEGSPNHLTTWAHRGSERLN